MLLLNKLILFFFGKYILIMKKKPFIANLIVKIFVSPLSIEHYSALMIYLYMIK